MEPVVVVKNVKILRQVGFAHCVEGNGGVYWCDVEVLQITLNPKLTVTLGETRKLLKLEKNSLLTYSLDSVKFGIG